MDLIMEFDGLIDDEFCKEIIDKYECDTHNKDHGLNIIIYKDWKEINDKLTSILAVAHSKYIEWFRVVSPFTPKEFEECVHPQFKLENHERGYKWFHADRGGGNNNKPALTFFVHLNDVENDGETDFVYKKIKPKAGRLVVFPSTLTSIHSGLPCSDNKYIIVGNFHSK